MLLINRSDLDGDSLKMDLDSLDNTIGKTDPTKVEEWLGYFIPRTHLKTFELNGKFGFKAQE